jgi:hypothetical protein
VVGKHIVDPEAEKSSSDELSKHLSENANEEHLKLYRAFALGGAAASLAILVQLLQVGAQSYFVKLTVLAISCSLPLWITISAIYELCIASGAPGIQQCRASFFSVTLGFLTIVASISLFIGVAGILFFLLPDAAWLFFAVSAFCLLLAMILKHLLARAVAQFRKIT